MTLRVEQLSLTIAEETNVRAALDVTFAALLRQMGPENETPEGTPLPMVLEARPGGRWFRDLGNNDGHLWGHVQALKLPTLLEIAGPLFMSYPVVSNVQYRLRQAEGGTVISFRHAALGLVPDDQRVGLSRGWVALLERVRRQAEGGYARH
jgi:uncharacterized protein YndB with AHSA1/START domain